MNVEHELDFKSFRTRKSSFTLNHKIKHLLHLGSVSMLVLLLAFAIKSQVPFLVKHYEVETQKVVEKMDIVVSPEMQEINKNYRLSIYLAEEQEIFDKFNRDESNYFDISGSHAVNQLYQAIFIFDQDSSYSVFKNIFTTLLEIPEAHKKLNSRQLMVLKQKFETKLNEQLVLSQTALRNLHMEPQTLQLSLLKLEQIKAKESKDMLALLYPYGY